jgi:photosystem I P700 chlorophyll a apoprotein A2
VTRKGGLGVLVALVLLVAACNDAGEELDARAPTDVATEAPGATSEVEVGGQRPSSQVAVADPGASSEVEVRVGEILSRLETSTAPEGTIITLPERVLFDFDQTELKPEATAVLADIAEVVDFYREAPVSILGHTDDVGDEAYNDDLSHRRATAVADELVDGQGVERSRLDVVGLGERQPVAPNRTPDGADDPQGRTLNRRVEVVIEGVRPPQG